MAGRGWGKSRTGAEAVLYVAQHPELCAGRIGLIGRTAAAVRDDMLNGEGGILTNAPPWFPLDYQPSNRLIVCPNGVRMEIRTADEPRTIRGPNWGFVWGDEVAHWKNGAEALDQIRYALRAGERPRGVFTTTPIPIERMRKLVKNPRVRVVHGATYDNAVNLAKDYLDDMVASFHGTRQGRQELFGELLEDNPNALVQWEWLSNIDAEEVPELGMIGIGVDPATTDKPESNETGIIVMGLGTDERLYGLEDRSAQHSPGGWARTVDQLWGKWRRVAPCKVFAESNQGGDLVLSNVKQANGRIPVQLVHASKGKAARLELVSPYYEQGKISHVVRIRNGGHVYRGLETVESQVCEFDPTMPIREQNTDRMDALVWAVVGLMGGGSDRRRLRALGKKGAWDKLRASLHASAARDTRRTTSQGPEALPLAA